MIHTIKIATRDDGYDEYAFYFDLVEVLGQLTHRDFVYTIEQTGDSDASAS